jgi:hypothetical protein
LKISQLSSDELASRLIITAVNYKEYENNNGGFPYIRKGNFAILAQVCVGEKNDAGQYTACLTVTDVMLNNWGIEKRDIFEVAADNSKRLFPTICQTLKAFIGSQSENGVLEMIDGINMSEVTVITNMQHFNGAATIFYEPEILDRIAEQYGTDRLILMPSSINQIYCLPLRNNDLFKDCKQVYSELVSLIGEKNCLADNILTYDKKGHTITEANGQTYDPDIMSDNNIMHRQMEHGR